jgi:hypothetical protein
VTGDYFILRGFKYKLLTNCGVQRRMMGQLVNKTLKICGMKQKTLIWHLPGMTSEMYDELSSG